MIDIDARPTSEWTTESRHDDTVDTTELRWFADGSLPADIASWFTRSGTLGIDEARSDIYRVGGRPDIGIKLRSGTSLELKVRQSVGEPLVLGDGLAGRTEVCANYPLWLDLVVDIE